MLPFWTAVGVAWGGEAELAVERGWLLVELERFGDARDAARAVLAKDPGHAGARELYVEASAASGWGTLGAQELTGEPQAPAWTAAVTTLAQHVDAGDKKAVEADLATFAASWADEPDLLAPLWKPEKGPVVGLRKKWVKEALPAAWSEEAALRWRRLATAVPEPELTAAVLARAASVSTLVPPRPVLDHAGAFDLGQAWSEGTDTHPFAYPSELRTAGQHLHEIWTLAAKRTELDAFWSAVAGPAGDPFAAERLAALRLETKEVPRAREAAELAFLAAGAPQQTDRTATNEDRQKVDFALVLRTRAEVALAGGEVALARGDLGTAFLFAEKMLDSGLAEKLEKAASTDEPGLELKYRGARQTPAQVAVGRALAVKLDATTAPDVLAMAREARLLAFSGSGEGRPLVEDPGAWTEVAGDTWFLEGKALRALGKDAEARSALVVASLLLPADGEVWAARAAAHEALGERDAAFAAYAIARGKGVRDLDEKLRSTYPGLGDWASAAASIGGEPPPAPPPARPRGVAGTGGPARVKGAIPRLGESFPTIKVGDVSTSALGGKVVVISAFRSDCIECLQMLPTYAKLASRLRGQGLDTVMLTLNVDDDQATYDRIAVFARNWGQLGWNPKWAEILGIRRYPTTWVVDRSGVTRFYVDHWMSSQELETLVRQVR